MEEMEKLSYYTTCSQTCDEKDVETVLEGVGEYCRESNTLYLQPCPVCGDEMEVWGWLEECEECGERHDTSDLCGFEGEEKEQ
jgi:F0F1-type ATP synthase beta subunit